jgi:hypothetical protein
LVFCLVEFGPTHPKDGRDFVTVRGVTFRVTL